jgi:ATP-binding cassette subfamily B multidrug efflux pump
MGRGLPGARSSPTIGPMDHLRRLLGFVRPYTRLAVLSLVLLAALVVLDLAIPRLIQRIIDQGIARRDSRLVVETALIMLGISALSAVIAIGNNLFSVQVGEGVARDLREALFLKIQSYSFGNLDRQKTGQLLVRLTSDVSAIKSLTQISLRIGTRAPLMLVGSLILMVSTSPRLALALLPLLLVTSVLIGFFILRTEPLFRTVQAKLDVLNGVLQENIAGARLVKSLVRGGFEGERFELANGEMTERSIAVMQFAAAMMPSLTLCINVGMVVVIWAGGLDAISGELSVGQIVAFTNYMLSTMTPLVMMTMLSNTWAAGLASAARVQEVLDTAPEVQDADGARELPAGAPADVEFRDVSFAYRDDPEPVLQQIVLHAKPGQTIAILGATGSGKSTLVQLIPRFYDATDGEVRFAGNDVRELQQASLLRKIGIVPQESLLFSGTVRDNIRYGNPSATDAQVVAAARAAQAHEFIAQLPDGYDARVAPRGANFSGGQKQRLAIARALLPEPDVLIFDDSTSAVDVETETKIQDALAEKSHGRTTFIVAQRVSTVLKADTIVVLERGRVVATGTHPELMADSAVYQEIYASQLGGGIAESAGENGSPA